MLKCFVLMSNTNTIDTRFITPVDPRQLYFSISLVAMWLGYQPDNFKRLCKREAIPIKYPSGGRKAVVKYGHVVEYIEQCNGLSDKEKAAKLDQLERGRDVR